MTVLYPGTTKNMGDFVQILVQCFRTSLDPRPSAALSEAENTLKQHSTTPGYVLTNLEIVGMRDLEEAVRLAAALNFKNCIKANWKVDAGEAPAINIQGNEREEIKRRIFPVVIVSEPRIRKQLNEALSLIAASDFPQNWQGLLPELVQNLSNPAHESQIAVLEAMSAIFKPFHETTIDQSNDTLDYCQKAVAEKVIEVAEAAGNAVSAAAGMRDVLQKICTIVRISNDIVFSLNIYGLSLHMAQYAERWMNIWNTWLAFHDDALKEQDADVENAEDAMKAQIVHCCHQFLEFQEEDIQPYLPAFVTTIWGLLVSCSPKSGQDNLALAAISFLTSVARSTHHKLFASGETIKKICEGIVIPNMQFREEDEEAFEGNHVEYLRRDLEGSDMDTRRRAACDFEKCLVDQFPAETTEIITNFINLLLQQYAENPAANWARKDCALYMVMALAVKGKTAAAGATTVNELVDINSFCDQHIMPELTTADVNERPVLKADGLRYLHLFRSKISKAKQLECFPIVMRLLQADNNVVHSYAAIVIERILVLRVDKKPVFAPADISQHLHQLLQLLFAALGKPESTENEYLARAVMRVIAFVGPEIVPVAGGCLDWMTNKLLEVCRNPRFAGFNHCLFDAVAALINSTASDPPTLQSLEDKLFPCFDHVLQQDVQDFQPYVFQIFALLIVRNRELRAEYVDVMLKPFLQTHYWVRQGNIPALVILMQAYLQKAAAAIVAKEFTNPLLGIFQMVATRPRHFGDATALLTSICAYIPLQVLVPVLPPVFKILFGVLTSRRSQRVTIAFLVVLSRMICTHGPDTILACMEEGSAGSSKAVFTEVLPNNLMKIVEHDDKRVVAIATARVLGEFEALLTDTVAWRKLLLALAASLCSESSATVPEEVEEVAHEMLECSNEFSQLSNARLTPPVASPEVMDAKGFLAHSISRLSQKHPGQIGALMAPQGDATDDALRQFKEIVDSAGVQIS